MRILVLLICLPLLVNTLQPKDFTLYATCDNTMKLYVDGKHNATSDDWKKTTAVIIPLSAEVIEIHCIDLHVVGVEKIGGILASGSNGLITDSKWSCKSGTSWGPAYQIGPNGMKPWGIRPNISTAAKWIWTKGWKGQDKNVKCKIDFGPVCKDGVVVPKECRCGKGKCKPGEICQEGYCRPGPINGVWSEWSSFSPCSTSCGNGTKTRTQTCSNPPPAHGGKMCSGSEEKIQYQTFNCYLKQCLVGHCEDGKVDPVDTNKNWTTVTEHIEPSLITTGCFDINGNLYMKGESLESCCACFKFTCTLIIVNPYLHNFFWEKVRSESCCQDCKGTVYPAGSVMKTIKLDDSCNTTITTQCIYISQEKKAEVQEISNYKGCCSNSSGVYLTGTSKLVPETCSIQECLLPAGQLEASWLSTQKIAGCNCCVYNGSLINDGGWVILPDGKNATCCEGKFKTNIFNPPEFPEEKCFLEDTNITFHDLGKNQYGQETKPEWIIDHGGRRLIETKNTRPSVGLSNLGDPSSPVSFNGQVFSNNSDRDVIGMVFGYQREDSFFVVASASTNKPGPTNWYIGRVHATCGTSCASTRTISDAIWNPTAHPEDITILSSGTNYWRHPNIYKFSICFNPSKLLLKVDVHEDATATASPSVRSSSLGLAAPVLVTGTISAKTNIPDVDTMSRLGGFIGVYVDSQALTTWDQLDCTVCDLK